MKRLANIVCVFSLTLGSLAGGAYAAEPVENPAPSPDRETQPAEEPAGKERPGRRGKPKVIELEAMVIEGKVAKPQVFYVLGRSRVQYENLKMQRVFVDRIIEGAKKNPF